MDVDVDNISSLLRVGAMFTVSGMVQGPYVVY